MIFEKLLLPTYRIINTGGGAWVVELGGNIDLWVCPKLFKWTPNALWQKENEQEDLDVEWFWFWIGYTRRFKGSKEVKLTSEELKWK